MDDLNNAITNLIDKNFSSLIQSHKILLVKHLIDLVKSLNYYFNEKNIVNQLQLNDCQDIYGLLIMLLPFYDLTQSNSVENLVELFTAEKSKELKTYYYVDHIFTKDDVEHYFINSAKSIKKTFSTVSNKLMPNWINIFPHKIKNSSEYVLDNYSSSDVYKNFEDMYINKKFPTDDILHSNDASKFLLGYHTLYGTITKFFFDDIVPIKWIIYDILDEHDVVYPTIIMIADILNISQLINTSVLYENTSKTNAKQKKGNKWSPWKSIHVEKKKDFEEKWHEAIKDNNKFESLKSMCLFYIKSEYDKDGIEDIKLEMKKKKISNKCLKEIKTNIDFEEVNEKSDAEIEEEDGKKLTDAQKIKKGKLLDKCIKLLAGCFKPEKIYNYIFRCVQQFKYTWYGYSCMDDNKNILSKKDFLKRYIKENYILEYTENNITSKINKTKYYVTPKIIYNFFKSLIHADNITKNTYEPIDSNTDWYSLDDGSKRIFVRKLNSKYSSVKTTSYQYDIDVWFNIKNNLHNLYFKNKDKTKTKTKDEISKIMALITINLNKTNLIPSIITECLTYNGIFTYFKYNPSITDNNKLPDKNKFEAERKLIINSNISDNLHFYKDSYHFLDNTCYKSHPDIFKIILNSAWYTSFGADWIAQIQIFHNFINHRLMFVTGATGAGKSTVYPMMLLYALKSIYYNNNGKIVCTQPRIQPVNSNAERIADSFGIPIKKKSVEEMAEEVEEEEVEEEEVEELEGVDVDKNEENVEHDTKKGKSIPSPINYIQIQYKGHKDIIDSYFHPSLTFYTDGSLYNEIIKNYIFKVPLKSIDSPTNFCEKYDSKNIFDVLLIDESHEHNKYMDMILTVSKFSAYINNQITLGIISATMDNDEKIYRKYYKIIDDNWKFPLYNINGETIHTNDKNYVDKNLLDRRIHVSAPFAGTPYKVEEYYNDDIDKSKNLDKIERIKKILSTDNVGDILLFEAGKNDIKISVEELNKITPSNTLAVPFYSEMNKYIMNNYIKKIDDEKVKFSITCPKHISIETLNKIPVQQRVSPGTYTRVIIVATNIAEASITINSLTHVVDTGKHFIMSHDIRTNQTIVDKPFIAEQNRQQRKGRVGRTRPGKIYHIYKKEDLETSISYKICTENINDIILNIISTTDVKGFTKESDPYLRNEEDYVNMPDCLKQQYTQQYNLYTYYYMEQKINMENLHIVYPMFDGLYTLNDLIDDEGIFYIIHPDENDIVRDIDLNIVVRKGERKIINMISYFKNLSIFVENANANANIYEMSEYGRYMVKALNYFSDEYFDSEFKLEYVLTIMNLIIDIKSRKLHSIEEIPVHIINDIIGFCVFNLYNYKIILKSSVKTNSDFIEKFHVIPAKYLNLLCLKDILSYIKIDDSKNETKISLGREIKNYLEYIIEYKKYNVLRYEHFKLLINFYIIKLKIEIILFIYETDFTKSNLFNYYGHDEKTQKNIKKLIKMFETEVKEFDYFFKELDDYEKKAPITTQLSDYELLCFYVCKNMMYNILQKIDGTDLYMGFRFRDVNNLYRLNERYGYRGVKIVDTKVYNEFRNSYIFYMSGTSDNMVTNIMWIPEKVINILNNMVKIKPIINTTINDEKLRNKYSLTHVNYIYQKIDHIINCINKN